MPHEELHAPRSTIFGEEMCIATTRGFNRAVGYYPCAHAVNHIAEVEDDDTGKKHTNIERLYCPMRLLVKPEIDGTITREVQAMGYDVEIRQAIVVGPEDDSRPGGCNHSEPSYDDIMLRTNTSATRRQ